MRKYFIVLSTSIGILNAAEPSKNPPTWVEFSAIYNIKEPFRAGNWQDTFYLTDGSVLIHKPDEMVFIKGNTVAQKFKEEYKIGSIITGFHLNLPFFDSPEKTEAFLNALNPELRAQFDAPKTPPKSLTLKVNSTKEDFVQNLIEAGLLEDTREK